MDLIGDLLAFMWVAVLINTLGVKASTPAGGVVSASPRW